MVKPSKSRGPVKLDAVEGKEDIAEASQMKETTAVAPARRVDDGVTWKVLPRTSQTMR